ncbi:5070_t:CDS:2 [Diversispora eburnea]|uniref:5070_t:CDS:1 n=1 Tax=Diversispora eburnea TaxID=1213867 RepID=A0A9N9A7Y2_9GLOM|nr:5070_t:CDS:2 [Diversispora eburnea]
METGNANQKSSREPTGRNSPGNLAYQINIPLSDVFYDPPIPVIEYVPSSSCNSWW